MRRTRTIIPRTDPPSDRVRGVPLSHPGCAGLAAAGVRSFGLDWRVPGSVWGEGLSPTVLLFWVVSGRVVLADGTAAGPDHCLVVPPPIPKRLTASDGPLHAVYVHLAPQRAWSRLAIRVQVLPGARARHLAAVIAALADETVGDSGDALARPLSEVVLACCADLAAGDAAVPAERRRLQSLWDEVAATPARPWNVAGLAHRAGLSAGHFHRRVRALYGRAPMLLVRQIRLERAADLLRTSTATLPTIAAAVGYATGFALSNAMHRHLGARPRELRR